MFGPSLSLCPRRGLWRYNDRSHQRSHSPINACRGSRHRDCKETQGADLRGKTEAIRQLRQYWAQVDKIFSLNILILGLGEPLLHRAHNMRSRHGLLTTDSLILAAMDEYGIACLASRDGDFDHVPSITIYKPTDI